MLRIPVCLGLLLGSLPGLPEATPPRGVAAPAPAQEAGCPRGAAEPVVRKKIFPKTTFRRLPDNRSGLETVALPAGDQLTIRHEGCEYYVLRFRFTTTRFRQRPTALEPWFRNTAQLLTETLPGLSAPVDVRAGTSALRAHTSQHAQNALEPLRLGEEIDYGTGDMRRFLSVDRLQQLAGDKVAVEVSFATGPL